MQTYNKTLYGIQNDAERCFLVFWLLIVILSSLIEDSIILVATFKYKVFHLHKDIVAIIQHMAVCDLLQSIFRVFPVLTAVIADSWILPEFFGHLQEYVSVIGNGFTMVLTCALTTLKLLHLKYPLIARTWSKNTGHVICLSLWILVLCSNGPIFVTKIFYMRDNIFFNYANYECNYLHYSTKTPPWYKVYAPVSASIFYFLCSTILAITSILILVFAQKVRSRIGGRVRLEGTITVLLTVAVQFLSYLPSTVVYVTWMMGTEYNGQVWRTITSLLYVNIIANFYIYCITARSFREFLKSKTSKCLYSLRQSILIKVRPAQN